MNEDIGDQSTKKSEEDEEEFIPRHRLPFSIQHIGSRSSHASQPIDNRQKLKSATEADIATHRAQKVDKPPRYAEGLDYKSRKGSKKKEKTLE